MMPMQMGLIMNSGDLNHPDPIYSPGLIDSKSNLQFEANNPGQNRAVLFGDHQRGRQLEATYGGLLTCMFHVLWFN